MAANFAEINWKSFEVAVPAFITIIMMPLSYSIATGIACGFIFYPITMLISKPSTSDNVCINGTISSVTSYLFMVKSRHKKRLPMIGSRFFFEVRIK